MCRSSEAVTALNSFEFHLRGILGFSDLLILPLSAHLRGDVPCVGVPTSLLSCPPSDRATTKFDDLLIYKLILWSPVFLLFQFYTWYSLLPSVRPPFAPKRSSVSSSSRSHLSQAAPPPALDELISPLFSPSLHPPLCFTSQQRISLALECFQVAPSRNSPSPKDARYFSEGRHHYYCRALFFPISIPDTRPSCIIIP